MSVTDILVTFLVFAIFGFMIWSSLVKKNHPIVDKIKEWTSTPKEKVRELTEAERWQHPSIDKKIY